MLERVTQATLLGLDITSILSTVAYVNRVLLQINQRLYLLSQLKSQGTAVQALHQLFTGLAMSKITYALPGFAGQLTVDDRNRINAISRKALRRGVTHSPLLLILRKSLSILIANFSARLPTPVIVYTIYFPLKHLNTVLTILEKENTITSCLMLNYRCIKTVLLIDACLSLDDTLCVCTIFYVLCVFYSFLSSFTFHCNSLRLTYCIKGYLT